MNADTVQLLAHLGRSGQYQYWWTASEAKDERNQAREKLTTWFPAGKLARVPDEMGRHGLRHVFFGVHPTTAIPQRISKKTGSPVPQQYVRAGAMDIVAVNCLYADLDAKRLGDKAQALDHAERLDPSPSVVIDTGGGYHVYWLLDRPFVLNTPDSRTRADAAQKAWTDYTQGDHGAKDGARVLRLPGTRNVKTAYGPKFPTVTIVWADFSRLYSLDELTAKLPAGWDQERKTNTGQRNGGDFDKLTWATDLLKRLTPARADDYDEWIAVGMALHELGSAGLGLWDAWSRQSSKYVPGECERKWDSFHDTRDQLVTLGSLSIWADQDSPRLRRNAGPTASANGKHEPGSAVRTEPGQDGDPALPTILVNRYMRQVTADSLRAIQAANSPPSVFIRGGALARVRIDEHGRPFAEELTESATRGILDRCANFKTVKVSEKTQTSKDVLTRPPIDVVKDLLALGAWPGIPPLIGIATAPCFNPDGTINTEPGYQAKSGLYYHESKPLQIGDTTPTADRVEWAKNLLLWELLADFPFVDDASRANALALLLLPFVRPMITGPTPMNLVDTPQAGTGKGLLTETCALPFSPDGVSIMTCGRDDDEMRKRITSRLMAAPSHILIDNIQGTLDSQDLAAVLTSRLWSDRILGRSENTALPVRCCWIATGNNVVLSNELTRRVVWIRMDARVERPWMREGFRHPNLREWAIEQRPALVTAALTLIQNWIALGRPAGPVMGSFEDWSRTMGGILRACGVEGFIGNAGALYDRLDIERAAWLDLVAAWYEAHGSNQVGTAELFNLASSPDDPKDGERGKDILAQFLGDKGERSRKTKLGNLLRERVDRVFGQYRIVAAGTYQGAAQYRLLPVNLSEHSEPCEPVPTPAYIQKEKISELTRDRIGSPGSQVHESSPNGKLSEYEEDVIL